MSNKKQELAIYKSLKANNKDTEVVATLKDLISNHYFLKNDYSWDAKGDFEVRDRECNNHSRQVSLDLNKGSLVVEQRLIPSKHKHTYYTMYVYTGDSDLDLTNGNLSTLESLLNLYNN